ncbi:hypothetical protein MMPV_008639 [Pyropia vietnamensis]
MGGLALSSPAGGSDGGGGDGDGCGGGGARVTRSGAKGGRQWDDGGGRVGGGRKGDGRGGGHPRAAAGTAAATAAAAAVARGGGWGESGPAPDTSQGTAALTASTASSGSDGSAPAGWGRPTAAVPDEPPTPTDSDTDDSDCWLVPDSASISYTSSSGSAGGLPPLTPSPPPAPPRRRRERPRRRLVRGTVSPVRRGAEEVVAIPDSDSDGGRDDWRSLPPNGVVSLSDDSPGTPTPPTATQTPRRRRVVVNDTDSDDDEGQEASTEFDGAGGSDSQDSNGSSRSSGGHVAVAGSPPTRLAEAVEAPSDGSDGEDGDWVATRAVAAEALLSRLDEEALGGRLRGRVDVAWNGRRRVTAGVTVLSGGPPAPATATGVPPLAGDDQDDHDRRATIELSAAVVTTASRLHTTLCHEACHAAAWVLYGVGPRVPAAIALFRLLDEEVYGGALGAAVTVVWNARLRKTAGQTVMKRVKVRRRSSAVVAAGTGVEVAEARGDWEGVATPAASPRRTAVIQLSVTVLDRPSRLYTTLCHELCHAAAWVMAAVARPPHGPAFWSAAADLQAWDPSLNVSVCHAYEIAWRHTYVCGECGLVYGRQSRSIDVTAVVCGRCHGALTLREG